MKLAKKGLALIGILAMLLAMNGCSSSSSYRSSSRSSDYDSYDRKYSSEELGGFINEYKDTLGW